MEQKVEARISNSEYSKTLEFVERCNDANVTPTRRQASKFRNGKGQVYEHFKMKKERL